MLLPWNYLVAVSVNELDVALTKNLTKQARGQSIKRQWLRQKRALFSF